MRRILSRSSGRRILLLLVTIIIFVMAYETRMFDSHYASWQMLLGEPSPPPPGTTLRFDATAYCKGVTTASGVAAQTGVAAADPRLLPVGSVVNVSTGDQKYSGVYTIMDTGPQVQGRTLDLYMWSCLEATRFGRRAIDVTVLRLGWDPRASSPSLIDRLFRRREVARRVPPADPPPPAGIAPPPEPSGTAAPVPTESTKPTTEAPAGNR